MLYLLCLPLSSCSRFLESFGFASIGVSSPEYFFLSWAVDDSRAHRGVSQFRCTGRALFRRVGRMVAHRGDISGRRGGAASAAGGMAMGDAMGRWHRRLTMGEDSGSEGVSRSPARAFVRPRSPGEVVVAAVWWGVLACQVWGLLSPAWTAEYRVEVLSSVYGVLGHVFLYAMATLLHFSICYYLMEKFVASRGGIDVGR